MRSAWVAVLACLAAGLSSCSGKASDKANAAPAGLTPDQASIAQAQKISDIIGGCSQAAAGAGHQTKVITLEKSRIVMLSCSQSDMFYTDRLFLVGASDVQLLALPDYESSGWFSTDQASMAELDAGTGVLTTQRMTGGKEACGSEGRYQWTGARFDLEEMRWQACGDKNVKAPPFPLIWPATQAASADLSNSAPAP
jgi:hypothetical protein